MQLMLKFLNVVMLKRNECLDNFGMNEFPQFIRICLNFQTDNQ